MIDAVIDSLIVLFGAGIALWSARSLIIGARSEHWPRAIGTIVSSKVAERRDGKGSLMYSAGISYRYSVHGKELTGDTVKFGGQLELNSQTRATSVVEKYPAGATVPVFYDPDDPRRSVLEPGKNPVSWFGVAFGTVFLAVGVWLLAIGSPG